MKSVIIDLLDSDLAGIPEDLGGDVQVIRNYSVPNDNDLAIAQAKRILDGIQIDGLQALTIYIPPSAFAFGMVLVIARNVPIPFYPRVVVQHGRELIDLTDFQIKEII